MNKILKFSFIYFIFTLLFSCSFQNSGGFFESKIEEFEKEIQKKNSKLFFTHKKNLTKKFLELFQVKKQTSIELKNGQKTVSTIKMKFLICTYKNHKNILFKSKKIGKNKFKLSDTFFEPLIQKDKFLFPDFSGNIYNYSLDKNRSFGNLISTKKVQKFSQ